MCIRKRVVIPFYPQAEGLIFTTALHAQQQDFQAHTTDTREMFLSIFPFPKNAATDEQFNLRHCTERRKTIAFSRVALALGLSSTLRLYGMKTTKLLGTSCWYETRLEDSTG